MKKLIFFLLFANAAVAQTIYLPNIKGTLTGTVNGSHNAADVNVVGGGFTGAVDQGNKGSINESWYVQPCDGTNCQLFTASGHGLVDSYQGGAWSVGRTWNLSNSTDSVDAAQSGAWSVGRTWNLSSGSDSVSATQSGSWSTGRTWALSSDTDSVAISGAVGVTGTVDANVISSVLPTGASTSANQTTGNSSLATIATNTTGVSTAANQTTGNASLSSIDGKLGSLGQKPSAGSAPVVLASDQTSIPVTQAGAPWSVTATPPNISGFSSTGGSSSSQQSFTAPASTKYLLVQGDPANTDNIRFGSVSTSATVGMILAPGQDSGLMPFSSGAAVFVYPVTGTQKVNITWLF